MSASYWDTIHRTRRIDSVGWFEPDPTVSRRLVADAVANGAQSLIDVGGGASSLVDHVLDLGLDRVAVLDISDAALQVARTRLGPRSAKVEWIVGDVATVTDVGTFDIWHDRAVFHFLLEDAARAAYAELAERTVDRGGSAIVATFAPDGPERCSGLPVRRYDAASLADECGPAFRLTGSVPYLHRTPAGVIQSFQYATFDRV